LAFFRKLTLDGIIKKEKTGDGKKVRELNNHLIYK